MLAPRGFGSQGGAALAQGRRAGPAQLKTGTCAPFVGLRREHQVPVIRYDAGLTGRSFTVDGRRGRTTLGGPEDQGMSTGIGVEQDASTTTVCMAQVMQPSHANVVGNVHGGTIMKMIDEAAAVVAIRHARRNVVTASIDRLDFHAPAYVGNLVIFKASLNYVGRSSMEVGVRVEAEDLKHGTVRHTASAYLTFVALDEAGKPAPVPPLVPATDDDRRRQEAAARRHAERVRTRQRRG
jgi:acyl-CoA hydrolase